MATKPNGRVWVGFDLGGTKMLAVVYDGRFRPLARQRKRTRGHEGVKGGLKRLVATISEALDAAGVGADRLAGIGVGCPGPLNLDKGIVLETPNLGWKNAKVRAELEGAFGCPTVIANDVDAGTYGEYRFGAARGARCALGVFPGTGIGGGAVYEGAILRGRKGSALEIGHIPVERGGALCGCGRRGCLETVASRLAISAAAAAAAYRGKAPNLLQLAGTDGGAIRSGPLAKSIAAGDVAVEAIVREAARTVGWAMAGVVNTLAPDRVVLGGGLVEEMPELYREEVVAGLEAQVMPSFKGTYKVAVAELGDDATVKGAAAWAQQIVAPAEGGGRLQTRRVGRVAVDLLRIEGLLVFLEGQRDGTVHSPRPGRDRAVETRAVADVATGVALDLDPEPDGVLVVVDAHLDDGLHQPAGRALVPQHLARAAPVDGLAQFDGAGEGLGVHVGVHQHLARVGVGGDHGDQAVLVKLGC